jgi:hypothetical protein
MVARSAVIEGTPVRGADGGAMGSILKLGGGAHLRKIKCGGPMAAARGLTQHKRHLAGEA